MLALAARLSGACLFLPWAASARELIKGISYGPTPVTTPSEAARLPQDDWFCNAASPMWSSEGRGDLQIIKSLGANLVRLYGNNPANDHSDFLDEAHELGLQVAPGMSDWPFYQQVPGNCITTQFNCFTQIKEMYTLNLQNGFLTADGRYHPAIRVMNIINEPDLKMPSTAVFGGPEGPVKMARAIISAFDAMLEAEAEAHVEGPLINFTATFSYAICSACSRFQGNPALGQIAQLDDAMHFPQRYGYNPRNNIAEAYRTRWMHSFNTQNPATDLETQFLNHYVTAFPTTPVYIGEYHRVAANQTEDVGRILAIARRHPLFLGISFFEFSVSYWKTGTEMDFGLFGYGESEPAWMSYFEQTYRVHCLVAQPNPESGLSMAQAVANVYGGRLDTALLCGGGARHFTRTRRTTTTATVVNRSTLNHTTVPGASSSTSHLRDATTTTRTTTITTTDRSTSGFLSVRTTTSMPTTNSLVVPAPRRGCSTGEAVQCPYSDVRCAGPQCCPGSQETNFMNFVCPSAEASWAGQKLCQHPEKLLDCLDGATAPASTQETATQPDFQQHNQRVVNGSTETP